MLGCRVGTAKSQTRDALARLRAVAPGLLSVATGGRRGPTTLPAGARLGGVGAYTADGTGDGPG